MIATMTDIVGNRSSMHWLPSLDGSLSGFERQSGTLRGHPPKAFSRTKPNVRIGDDELNRKEVFRICETSGGTSSNTKAAFIHH
jgi:hypothetical protein